MKPILFLSFMLFLSFSSMAQSKVEPDEVSKIKIRCCVKLMLPQIKFKRPKKDCKSGFGICYTDGYACVLCNTDGTVPDCVKCVARTANPDDIEISIKTDGDLRTLEIPSSIKLSKYFVGEDFSKFVLDYDFTVYNAATNQIEFVLKAGEYNVTEEAGLLKIKF